MFYFSRFSNIPFFSKTIFTVAFISLWCFSFGQTTIFTAGGGGMLPTGWSSVNANPSNPIDKGSYWLVETSPRDTIETTSYNLSTYGSAEFDVNTRSFGSGSHNSVKVEASLDGGATYTQSFTGATTTTSYQTSGVFTISPVSANVVLRITVSGASGRHVRLQDLELRGIGTPCTIPVNVSTASATPAVASMNLNWTNSSCFDEVVVFVDQTAGIGTSPSGGAGSYTGNASYSSNGQCVYNGVGSSFITTGLTGGSTYYFEIFTRKGTTWSSGVEVSGTALAPINNIKGTNFDGTNALDILYSSGVSISSSSTSHPTGNSFGTSGNGAVTSNSTDTIFTCVYTMSSVSEFSFNLASLSGTSGNGADVSDYVAVDVSTNAGSSYTTIMTINGYNNARWLYSAVDSAVTSYSSPTTDATSAGGNRTTIDGIGKVKITGIPSGEVTIRIRLKNNSSNEYWVIDDLELNTATAATFSLTATGVTNESISASSGTAHTLEWTNPDCYTDIVVIAKELSAPTFDPSIQNCSGFAGDCLAGDFMANTVFGTGVSGTNLPTGEYCVYRGSGTSVTVTGLTGSSTYHYEIFTHLNPWSSKAASPNLTIVPIPVELMSIKGKMVSNYVQLDWSTASEHNNSGFEVERSTNGEVFVPIDFVIGKGNSQQISHYSSQDYQPSKFNYYRLKQIDFDGNYKYSDIVRVSEKYSNLEIKKQGQNIMLSSNNEEATYHIYSAQGKLVATSSFAGSLALDLSNEIKGMFVIQLQTRNEIIRQKVTY